MRIRFIVNGETAPVDLDVGAPLFTGMRKALDDSENTARPLEDWELRDVSGVLLDRTLTAADYAIADDATLFATLRVGAGGA